MSLTEFSTPVAVERPDLPWSVALIRERARLAPKHIAFHVPATRTAPARNYTLPEFLGLASRVAIGLRERGFQPGDAAAIMAATSFDWALAEWSTWIAGGVVVPIYETSPAATADTIITATKARVLFADADRAPLLTDLELDFGVVTFTDSWIYDFAPEPTAEELRTLETITRSRDDVASIVFTSGTTGEPHGTKVLHRNFVDLVLNVQYAWKSILNEDGSTVIFLPLAHVLARGLQMICMWAGMRVTYMSQPAQLIKSLPALQPTFLVVVPRVAEKIVAAVRSNAESKHLGKLWNQAERTAEEWGCLNEEADRLSTPINQLASFGLRARHALFDRLFYKRIRSLLGGKLEFMLAGAAPLAPSYSLIFRGFGLPIMEGYGLTETTAPMSGNRPGAIRSGTVGQLVPGTSVRIADDGEILVRGIGVTPGYIDDGHTASAFTDGYFHTGDLGTLSDDGFLTVTGRAKDVLITAGGKNVYPARWEAKVEEDPLVSHAMIVGDRQPYLSAIVVLERSEIESWFEAEGIDMPEIPENLGALELKQPQIMERLKELMASANETVSRAEAVKKIRAVVVDLPTEAALLTPTLKLKKKEAIARFEQIVADLYGRKKIDER